jgi:hypothetical protein
VANEPRHVSGGILIRQICQTTFQMGEVALQMGKAPLQTGEMAMQMGKVTLQMGKAAKQMGWMAWQMGKVILHIGEALSQMGKVTLQTGEMPKQICKAIKFASIVPFPPEKSRIKLEKWPGSRQKSLKTRVIPLFRQICQVARRHFITARFAATCQILCWQAAPPDDAPAP